MLTKNLKKKKQGSKQYNKKLNHVKVGLFFIKKTKKLVNYKLNLLKDTKIYLIFYIFLLKLVNSDIPV